MIRILLALIVLAPAARTETTVVKAGRVIVGDGREIANGMILIEDGRVAKVGTDLEIPPGATVIDATGKVVMPGLIDANSAAGLAAQRNEDSREVTPEVRFLDSVEPGSRELRRALQSGITTVYVGPGNRNVIGGLGAVIRTHGRTARAMTIREDAALKAAMGSAPTSGNYPPRGSPATFYARRPTTRMGVVWEFRKAFFDARKGIPGNAPLLQAMDRKLPVRIAAARATDIEEALRLAEEFGLSIVVEEAQEAWAVAALLADRKVPILLRPTLLVVPGFSSEAAEGRLNAFARLREAGVTVALLPPEGETESLLAAAALAVKHGARRDDALRAVTSIPAEILGVADSVGTLGEGKDADLLILSGDPLEATSAIERVMVRGKTVSGKE